MRGYYGGPKATRVGPSLGKKTPFSALTTGVVYTTVVLWSQGAMERSETKMPKTLFPNYTGRLLDRIILTVIKQTSNVRHNPDDTDYPGQRVAVLKRTAMALFKARNEMQQDRRDEEARMRSAESAAKTPSTTGSTPTG